MHKSHQGHDPEIFSHFSQQWIAGCLGVHTMPWCYGVYITLICLGPSLFQPLSRSKHLPMHEILCHTPAPIHVTIRWAFTS